MVSEIDAPLLTVGHSNRTWPEFLRVLEAASIRTIFDVRRYQFGLLGHVDLRGSGIDAARILSSRRTGRARDKAENVHVAVVPWTAPAVLEMLRDPLDWIAHGWLNLALSAVESFRGDHEAFEQLLDLATTSTDASVDWDPQPARPRG